MAVDIWLLAAPAPFLCSSSAPIISTNMTSTPCSSPRLQIPLAGMLFFLPSIYLNSTLHTSPNFSHSSSCKVFSLLAGGNSNSTDPAFIVSLWKILHSALNTINLYVFSNSSRVLVVSHKFYFSELWARICLIPLYSSHNFECPLPHSPHPSTETFV